ncbi:CCA tRNA nucleotidyltransferase [Sulfurovum riftiae]|uniref:Polynucleotide adenylyltransferase n=1 Tax=Sulfurovum riftiae TaxID=1630136 RepID=A0A151CGI6_9BACT|nr:HD domain-containing protein [Sulfurovum riftiae]KYJ86599.1 hypothetical protein AS592_07300 [Sulfurovum riftiae]
MNLPPLLEQIAKKLQQENARAVLVGGAVRDMIMGYAVNKDYDVEVYGLASILELEKILSAFGSVNLVGRSFGVLKLVHEEEEYDFSFPRLEKKTGKGHRGFDVVTDGKMDFEEASRRRDFTINAMGYDIESGTFLDPFNGRRDMELKQLRHIDDSSFVEDPLRVYRAVQFSARFGYGLADETEKLCREMVERGMLEELPKERVYIEIKKLLLKADRPSVGFELMRRLGITERCFPELHALIDVPQDPEWHPEGDVWVHTMLSIDAMERLIRDESAFSIQYSALREEKQKLKLLFAVLCHDFGKPLTTIIELENGEVIAWDPSTCLALNAERFARIRAISHEKAGVEPARSFIYRLTDEHDFIESILPLIEHHLKPLQFYKQGAKASAIRRLATKVNIEELVLVAKADFLGRTTEEAKSAVFKAGEWLLEKAKTLKVEKKPLECLVRGKDLIALGLKPSPEFKTILNEVYELQMEGTLETKEEALAYVKKKFCGAETKSDLF